MMTTMVTTTPATIRLAGRSFWRRLTRGSRPRVKRTGRSPIFRPEPTAEQQLEQGGRSRGSDTQIPQPEAAENDGCKRQRERNEAMLHRDKPAACFRKSAQSRDLRRVCRQRSSNTPPNAGGGSIALQDLKPLCDRDARESGIQAISRLSLWSCDTPGRGDAGMATAPRSAVKAAGGGAPQMALRRPCLPLDGASRVSGFR